MVFKAPIYTLILFFQYYTPTGLPGKRLDPGVCGICGNSIIVMNNDDAIIENTCKLGCDHVYPLPISASNIKQSIVIISKGK